MEIINQTIAIVTEPGINIHDITPQVTAILEASEIQNGHIIVFGKHTTTALGINEYEARLLEDLKVHFAQFAPPDKPYLHNDLHLRNVPLDEPENAHSHLIALALNNSETIPIINGKLALGQYQSILFFELDGARNRQVLVQISGEK